VYTGVITYFGDNKKPGFDLHDTPRRGNRRLQSCFAGLHNAPDQKVKIPPFFVFAKGSKGRDVVFRGLAVPGVEADPPTIRSQSGAARRASASRTTGQSSRSWIPGPFLAHGSKPLG
jgi:hypothetical protein